MYKKNDKNKVKEIGVVFTMIAFNHYCVWNFTRCYSSKQIHCIPVMYQVTPKMKRLQTQSLPSGSSNLEGETGKHNITW